MADRRVTFLIGANYKNFKEGLSNSQKEFRKWGRKMERLGQNLTTKLTLPIIGIGAAAVREAGNLEKLRTQMDILTGSTEAGGRAFERLKNFSAKTPFQINDIVKASNTLMGFGMNADEAFESIQNIGDIAAVTGGDVQSIAVAFGQANAEQKLFTKDIRQLINQGVPAIELLSNTMGVAQSEVLDLASQGKISFDILNRSFQEATSEGGKFAGGMEKQSKTILGQLSTLRDNLSQIAAVFGEVIVEALNPYTRKIREMVEAGQTLDKGMVKQIVTIGALAAALGPAVMLFGKLAKTIAFLISPLALKIAALTALAGALWYVIENTEAFEQNITYYFKKAVASVGESISEFLMWLSKMASATGQTNLAAGLIEQAAKIREGIHGISMDEPTVSFMDFSEFVDTMKERVGQALDFMTGKIFDLNTAQEQTLQRASVMGETFFNGVVPALTFTTQEAEEVDRSFRDMSGTIEFVDSIATTFTDSFGQGMANIIVAGDKVVDVLSNIGRLLASAVIQKGLKMLLGSASGGTGLLGSLFGGFFADGGTLRPGEWGIVGERGPEPIMATPSGAVIIPNHKATSTSMSSRGGAGQRYAVVNVNIDSRTVDQQLVALNEKRSR